MAGQRSSSLWSTCIHRAPHFSLSPAVGSWWNRQGDEIDLLAIAEEADLVLEIKNTTLTRSGTYSILTSLKSKTPGNSGPLLPGLTRGRCP